MKSEDFVVMKGSSKSFESSPTNRIKMVFDPSYKKTVLDEKVERTNR